MRYFDAKIFIITLRVTLYDIYLKLSNSVLPLPCNNRVNVTKLFTLVFEITDEEKVTKMAHILFHLASGHQTVVDWTTKLGWPF